MAIYATKPLDTELARTLSGYIRETRAVAWGGDTLPRGYKNNLFEIEAGEAELS